MLKPAAMEQSSSMQTRNSGTPLPLGSPHNITWTQQIVCSCSGALVTSVCTTPLDVVKTRLQAQQKTSSVDVPKSSTRFRMLKTENLLSRLCVCSTCNDLTYSLRRNVHPLQTSEERFFKGAMDAFVNISRREGIRSLWSGLPATLVMAVPATVVYYTVYDRLKYRMGYTELDSSTIYIPVLAGCLARICTATLISPLELIRTKMQSTRLTYVQLVNAIRISVHHNGFLFMMKGLGPSLLRDVPFSAIFWLGYESSKAYHMRKYGTSDPGTLVTFVGGAASGMMAAVLTLPFDVVKTHRQMELGEEMTSSSRKITSTWSLMSNLYRNRGLSALYAGAIPRLVKVAPACAIMITIYESGKSFFRARNELSHQSLQTNLWSE